MIALAAVIITTGCSAGGTEGEPAEETTEVQGETDTMEDTEKMIDENENIVTSASLPEELAQIPEENPQPRRLCRFPGITGHSAVSLWDLWLRGGHSSIVWIIMPSSGSITSDGEYMASLVRDSGHEWNDFFIFAASGTDDFAYSSFENQIESMTDVDDGTFRFADNEREQPVFS